MVHHPFCVWNYRFKIPRPSLRRRKKIWSCNSPLDQEHLLPKILFIYMQSHKEGHGHWQRKHPSVLIQFSQVQNCSLAVTGKQEGLMLSLFEEIWTTWASCSRSFSASLLPSWQKHPPHSQDGKKRKNTPSVWGSLLYHQDNQNKYFPFKNACHKENYLW